MKKNLLTATFAIITTAPLPASVVYVESFSRATSNIGNQALDSGAGWTNLTVDSTSGFVQDSSSNTSDGVVISTFNTGSTVRADGLNDNAVGSGDNGFLFFSTNGTLGRALTFTTEEVGTAGYTFGDLNSLSVTLGNNSTTPTAAAAIRADGQWYVSAGQTVTSTLGSAGAFDVGTGETKDFLASGDWFELDFTIDSSDFTVAGTASTISSTATLDAWGLYGEGFTGGAFIRADGFTANAVPEPSSVLLTGAALFGALVRRRR